MKVCQPSGHFFLNFGRVVKVAVLSKIPDGLAASLFMFRRVSEKSFLDVTEHRGATYFQPAAGFAHHVKIIAADSDCRWKANRNGLMIKTFKYSIV